MYNPYSLEGKQILVTGASSGIGRATAVECAKLGAKVIITARNVERLRETYNQLEGSSHLVYECDLSNPESIVKLVSEIPVLDGMVCNAGTTKRIPLAFMKYEDVQRIFNVNTIAPMLFLKEVCKKKKINKCSSVVFTSSMAGVGAAATGNGVYTASKGAISSFIKVAALELAPRKIRVNAVCPGMTRTPMIYDDDVQDEELQKGMECYPLGRYGEPQDIAWAMIYLLSDASSWVTGTNLIIDGGLTIK